MRGAAGSRTLPEPQTVRPRRRRAMQGDEMTAGAMSTEHSMKAMESGGSMSSAGHLYMQTNELRNVVIHYRRAADGTITEVERVPTGGAGSGVFKPISGQESAPNAFEGARSIILTPDL